METKKPVLLILFAAVIVSAIIFLSTLVSVSKEMDALKNPVAPYSITMRHKQLPPDFPTGKDVELAQKTKESPPKLLVVEEANPYEQTQTPIPTLYDIPFGNFHEEHLYRLDPTEMSDYLYVRKEFMDFYQSYQASYNKNPNIWNDAINGFQLELAQRLGDEGMIKISN
jgi:uncharacterized membrane protein